jgi:UDP-glucose 4-epimerase
LKILIIGGTGFIGANLTRYLAAKGNQVWCFSNSVVQHDALLETFWKPYRSQIVSITGDVTDRNSVKKAFSICQPSHVVHLAAITSSNPGEPSIENFVEVNILGTINVLEAATSYRIGRFIYVSSAAVYGRTEESIKIKEDIELNGTGSYAMTKIASESFCKDWGNSESIKPVIVRLGGSYGPMERPLAGSRNKMSLVYELVTKALSDTDIRLADLDHARDWIFVEDVSHALESLLKQNILKYQIYNLSSGVTITHRELLTALAKVIPVSFRQVGSTEANIPSYLTGKIRGAMSIERLLLDTCFVPTTNLEKGLKLYINWIRNNTENNL